MTRRAIVWVAASALAVSLVRPASASHCGECDWYQGGGAYGSCGHQGPSQFLVRTKERVHRFFYVESPYPGCCPTEYQRFQCRQYYQRIADYHDSMMHYADTLKHQVGAHRCCHSACGDCGQRCALGGQGAVGGMFSTCGQGVAGAMLPGSMPASVAGQFMPESVPQGYGPVETVGHHTSLR